MRRLLLAMFSVGLFAAPLRAGSTWQLESSTLTYHAYHAMHNTVGVTNSSRGKGICKDDGCDFLIAVPVNTFQSGDANRDLHMVQAVNGGTHPMISVRTHTAAEPAAPSFKADLTVDFGGKTFLYPNVSFGVTNKAPGIFQARGTLELVLSNHDVKRPSLLGVAVKDNAPVEIETIWRKR